MNVTAATAAISLTGTSQLSSRLGVCISDGEQDNRSPVSVTSGENERPERMRDWMIRMINSERFIGLDWLDEEKTVFKVPWIHAKKRGYCRDRDAALFREWALHSGKYRQDSDPTVWKINFRCAINGLKDIHEIKDMQTEECRVYKVYPSRSRRRRRTKRTEPYPTTSPYPEMSSQHLYSTFPTMRCSFDMPCSVGPASSTESLYSNFSSGPVPNMKLEYPGVMCGVPSNVYSASLPETMPCNGIYQALQQRTVPMIKQSSFGDQVTPIQIPSTKKCRAIARVESPDSGINVEVQNSPTGMMQHNSPLHQQHSPPLHQQHSPPLHQQHSPPLHQQHSPPFHQQQSPSLHQQHSPPLYQQHSPSLHQQHSPLPTQQFSPVDKKPFDNPIPSVGVASPLDGLTSCRSPSIMGSPCSTILSKEDDIEMSEILKDLEDNPPTPPTSPQVLSGEVQVNVFYGSICVLSEQVDCSNGKCRIVARRSPPSPEENAHFVRGGNGYPTTHTLVLPDNHPQALSQEIFNAMDSGITVEVSNGDVYVTPHCLSMIYCSSSLSPSQDAHMIPKDQASRVFNYNQHFRPALEHYALIQGQSPSPHFFLGLGQTWGRGRHVTQNLVTIMVTYCKAKYDIDTIGLPQLVAQELLVEIPDTIDIDPPTTNDLQAEAFLKNLEEI